MNQLLKIMEMLRDKEHGCAWDIKQTFQSVAPHTLEEVYEVIDCIEQKDYQHLPNELGDLLFQVVFYAQIAKESSLFDFNDVVAEISKKLLTRHPHVFPQASIESFGQANDLTPEQVEANWERIKQQERKGIEKNSVLDDIPKAFPALIRARKLQSRAAHVNFDWTQLKDVVEKVKEEIVELEEAIEEKDDLHIQEEFGDVLFTMVNLSRHLKLDSESCLRAANEKFESRFKKMEELIKHANGQIDTLSVNELETYWQKVKSNEKKSD